ncbi:MULTISPECIES: DUF1648 domain-containing protein [unclassified Streptomyces]|uniref:DUF1648 domain-containing protein n=1 Tax=unclassified Streptomyces TaxID=2593676 RepID=UPI00081DD1FE|nr:MULTISPECIES: DUF1648 domain-containing protein [unclassified Streptomyces]MYR95594.1 DUF1648 domain-containing protein [Streptomyces sp. SID4937]SCD93343.1 Protein of unknown function [Streptomyces sp. ScaeMP-e83]
MTRKNLGRATLAALPFVLALLVDLILFLVLKDRLPTRLASHFDATGDANGYVDRTAYVLVTAPVMPVLGALWVLMAVSGKFYGRAHRWLIAGGWAVAAFLQYALGATLVINLDVPEGGEADGFPMWHLAAAFGAAALAGAVGLLLARLVPAPEDPRAGKDPADRERIALADGEVAGWARTTGSWWLPLGTLAVAAAGAVLGYAVNWLAAAPLFLLALLTVTFCRPHVTVDRRGLTVSGLLPWPRVQVPLERIEGADSRQVDAIAEFGGWGYRIRPGRTGFIVRSGEAIVARQTGGREFAVTVEDSATGAALLNTLVDRNRAGR